MRPNEDGEKLASRFEKVVREHHERIFNFIFYMIGDREEASDLTQETFVRAYAAFPEFRGDATVKTWLSRIARNLTINRLRQQQLERQIYLEPPEGHTAPQDWDMPVQENPLARLEAKELKELVHRCLNELQPDFKEVILLRDMEGYSYKEMAQILDCSMEALKSRLFRARMSLREKIKPYLFPSGEGEE